MSDRGGKRTRLSFAQMRVTPGAFYVLLAEVVVSLLYALSPEPTRLEIIRWLAPSGSSVWQQGYFWQLLTGPILEPRFISLVFHGFILWTFVPTLERWWGIKRFLKFFAATSVAATFSGTVAGLALGEWTFVVGLDPFIYASIVAFGVLYANRPVQFFGVLPMTGRQLMLGITAFVFLLVVLQGQWASGAAYAAAMGLAWLLTSGKWNPKLWFYKAQHRKVKRHLKLVRDDAAPKDKTWLN